MEIETSDLLVVFDKKFTRSELQAASRTRPGSYADELVTRIYDWFFQNMRDLYAEYTQYYAIEYPDFAEFLYWKYRIRRDTAQEIKGKAEHGGFAGYGNNRTSLATDETFISVLKHLLSSVEEPSDESSY